MNSPTFNEGTKKKVMAVKVHDQMQNQSGSISGFFKNPNTNTDMSSVSNLEGIERSVQKRFEAQQQMQQPPCLLLNSPTFNTLDNRFESLNPDSSRVMVGGLGATGSREDVVKNVFTDSTWPGLKKADSIFNDQPFQEEGPRIASPNA